MMCILYAYLYNYTNLRMLTCCSSSWAMFACVLCGQATWGAGKDFLLLQLLILTPDTIVLFFFFARWTFGGA